MRDKELKRIFDDVLEVLSLMDNKNDIFDFLRDLLSEKEIIEFSNRFLVAQKLEAKVPYSKIEKETWTSSTTIARISRFLNGKNNGYKKAISLLKSVSHRHHTAHCSK